MFSNLFHEMNDMGDQKYFEIFKRLKPLLIEKIHTFLDARMLSNSGRPITTDFNKFLDALFFIVESGSQIRYVKDAFGIPKSTFYRYFKIISDHHILKNIYEDVLRTQNESIPNTPLITDTFTVKSMRGSKGLGRSATDRGRKGLKVSLICDTKRVVRAVHIGKANTHDTKLLLDTIDQIEPTIEPNQIVTCLCDSGYVGKELRETCLEKRIRLVVKPRRTRKRGKMTHVLLKTDAQLLREKRNQIELLNGHIRRFRSLMIKWVQCISTYECFLYVALLSITCYQLFVKH